MNIIITGASRGIGRAIAEAFAEEGHELFLCSKNEMTLYKTLSELQVAYPQSTIKAKATDMSDKTAVTDFANWLSNAGVVADVVVNNAGHFLSGNIYNEPEGLLEEMISTNLYSAYNLSRALIPAMIQKKSGHIFNICSIASLAAYPNGGSYSISKYAMAGFSKNLREEMKPHHIKVTAVYPGAVMTDSWKGFDNSGQRIMEARDIAGIVLACSKLSPQAVVEDIVLRPQLGDL